MEIVAHDNGEASSFGDAFEAQLHPYSHRLLEA